MDKNDLLKRFSKVHNRPLQSLNEIIKDPTEAIEQRTKEAGGLLKNAPWTPLNPNNPQGTQTAQVGQGTVNWNPKNNKVSNNSGEGLYDPNAGIVSPIPGKSEKRFKSFISSIVPYESPSDFKKPETPKIEFDPIDFFNQTGIKLPNYTESEVNQATRGSRKQAALPGATAARNLVKFTPPKERDKPSIKKAIASISQSFLNMSRMLEGSTLIAFIRGESNKSFEYKISNKSFTLRTDKTGKLIKQDAKPAVQIRKRAVDLVENLVNLATGGRSGSKKCGDLDKFAMSGDNLLIFTEGRATGTGSGDVNGLSIEDSPGTFRKLYERAAEKCGKDTEMSRVTSLGTDKTGGDNANRGFSFEEVPYLLDLKQKMSEPGADVECLKDKYKGAINSLKKKVGKLNEAREGYVQDYDKTAVDLETLAMGEMANQLVEEFSGEGEDSSARITEAMVPFGSKISERGSIMSLPAGTETGQGKRQDVLEVFEDCDKAEESLKKGNNNGATPRKMKISELSKSQQGVMKCLVSSEPSAGKPIKGDEGKEGDAEICVIKTSLKNYMNMDKGITYGTQTMESQRTFAFARDQLANLEGEREKYQASLEEAKNRNLRDREEVKSELESAQRQVTRSKNSEIFIQDAEKTIEELTKFRSEYPEGEDGDKEFRKALKKEYTPTQLKNFLSGETEKAIETARKDLDPEKFKENTEKVAELEQESLRIGENDRSIQEAERAIEKLDKFIEMTRESVQQQDDIQRILGFDNTAMDDAMDYYKEGVRARDKILMLPRTADVQGPDGKEVEDYPARKRMAEVALETAKEAGVSEDDPSFTYLQDLFKASEEDGDDVEVSDQLVQKLANAAETAQLRRDLNSSDPSVREKAKNGFMLRVMTTGGDASDELGLEARVLNARKVYGFKHNKPIKECFDDFNVEVGDPPSGRVRIFHPSIEGGHLDYQLNGNSAELHVGKKVVEASNEYEDTNVASPRENSSIQISTALDKLQEALGIIKKKVRVFNTN